MERQNDSIDSVVMVFCTFSDQYEARQIGTLLIELQLAACVNITPVVESIYRWEGEVKRDSEALAIFKTTKGKLDELEKVLIREHSYDTPEIIALPVIAGSKPYLEWVRGETV